MAWYGKASTIDLSDWERGGGEADRASIVGVQSKVGEGKILLTFFLNLDTENS